jgi:hypothetical protein
MLTAANQKRQIDKLKKPAAHAPFLTPVAIAETSLRQTNRQKFIAFTPEGQPSQPVFALQEPFCAPPFC